MTWHRTKIPDLWLTASMLLFTALFFIYYPPIFAIRDESIYLSMTRLLRAGSWYAENPAIPMITVVEALGHRVPLYPPGNAVFLLPFSMMGWQSVFLAGFFLHIAGSWLFSRMAEFFDADTPLAFLLYFLFPPFLLYSRTIMSDMPSMVLFLAACVCYFNPKGSRAGAGALLGLNLFFRVSNAVLVVPFGIALLLNALRRREWKAFLFFCAGVIPFAVGVLIYNAYFLGSPFLTGYSTAISGVENFGFKYLPGNLAHYLISLCLMYPLMLAGVFLNRKQYRIEIFLLLGILLAFFGAYYFYDHFPGRLATWGFGTRFLFPVMPFLILAYADLLDRALGRLPEVITRVITALMILSLWAVMVFVFQRGDQELRKQENLKNIIYQSTRSGDMILYDSGASELLQADWGNRVYVAEDRIDPVETAAAVNSGQPVYWIERPEGEEEPLRVWLNDHLTSFRKQFDFREVAEKNGLRIFRILPQIEKGSA